MSETGTPSFGDVLRRLRIAAALSQEELAERSGVSRNGASALQRGLHPAPRLETVRRLADALDLVGADRAALLAAARPPACEETSAARRSPPRSPPLGSLPTPLTGLVGRESEVSALRAALRDDAVRWLTLTGPGGVGKTRLAVEVVDGLREVFPDGIVFVDLSPLTDPDLVVPTIAAALGVREVAGQSLGATVATVLAPKRLLLVLDNCERVLGAAPDLAALLAASSGLTIFTTSREPFHVRGEHQVSLPPLPLPASLASADQATIEEAARNPAITLFVERAQAVRPDFAVMAGLSGDFDQRSSCRLPDARRPVRLRSPRRADGQEPAAVQGRSWSEPTIHDAGNGARVRPGAADCQRRGGDGRGRSRGVRARPGGAGGAGVAWPA